MSESAACWIHVEPVAREPSEQRLYPKAQQSLVADGVDRDVGDRVAVDMGEEGVSDQLVDQLEDVGLSVKSPAFDLQYGSADQEVGMSLSAEQWYLGGRVAV
ncbi:hypothetical protein GCM10020358_52570 [Amorphoplanes nipponensis]|uniref:Uncharacterized protein n=1 Tax=Actinoplanes nipponensis TaxID=135950 RepID=A0A919JFP2_9ACTN|nr:hypothetical protein [Actinoplanes nipponensis]GIE49601.1 hypothetical protein Ani05nite_31350 [Actinoplanes nipponensis]